MNQTFTINTLLSSRNLLCLRTNYSRYNDTPKRSLFSSIVLKSPKTKEFSGRQLVGYTMEQMYSVVSDIKRYDKFVPWCRESIVSVDKPHYIKARLVVGFPPLHESYTSHVTLIKPHFVKAESKDSRVFNHMLSLWRFSPGLRREPQSCVVDFQITFGFKSLLHSHLANLFFDQVVLQMQSAFMNEVTRRYGPPKLKAKALSFDVSSHSTETSHS